jgi:hypothetical protein
VEGEGNGGVTADQGLPFSLLLNLLRSHAPHSLHDLVCMQAMDTKCVGTMKLVYKTDTIYFCL